MSSLAHRFRFAVRLWLLCCCVAFLLVSARSAAAQEPGDAEGEARVSVADDAESSSPEAEELAPSSPELTFPEVPETTVVGRPSPFPATPLGEGTVVTATRGEAFGNQVGSSMTVITEQDIARTRQGRVNEVLRNVPGLDLVQRGGAGQQSSVFIRGANSHHTKVLIDGIPANDPSSGQRTFDFSQLSVDNIQQIEVLRGPQSTLYGSDAIGGVVNIVTKRGEGPMSVRAGFEGGSFGTSRESLNVSGGTSQYHYSFGGSYQKASGFSQAEAGTENDRFSGSTSSGRFGWTPADNFDIDYVFRFVDQDVDIDDFDADHLFNQQRTDSFFNRVQARLMTLCDTWEHRVAFNLTDHDRRFTHTAFTPEFQGQTRKFEYLSNFYLSPDHTVTAGVDYWHEEMSDTASPLRSQFMTGIYLQDQIRLADRWFTTFGARFDQHSSAGSAKTYRVTTRYQVDQTGTAFHGSVGTGFRAPTIFELFSSWGNPGLAPEDSFGWDCGLEQSLFDDRFVVDCTYFRNDFSDLIQFVVTNFNPFTGEYRNVASAKSTGVELSARWELNPCTTLYGTYVHTLAKDQAGADLLLRPRHKASFTVNRSLCPCGDQANLYLSLLYVGPRFDFGGTHLSEYYLMNLAGTSRLNDMCELFARVDNALGENYQEAATYATAPISAYGGVNFRF